MQWRYAVPAALSLIAGLVIFSYDGFGVPFIRNYAGDFLVVVFAYSCLSLVWKSSVAARTASVFAVMVLVECVPLIPGERAFAMLHQPYGDLFLGTTFDLKDVATYAVASFAILAVENASRKSRQLPE